jgi:hypothetical protein
MRERQETIMILRLSTFVIRKMTILLTDLKIQLVLEVNELDSMTVSRA